jgi:hypothetical protein
MRRSNMEQTVEMFIEELAADEEFREAFFRNPRKALRMANEWGLPFTDTEVMLLIATNPSVWDRVAENLDARLQQAA